MIHARRANTSELQWLVGDWQEQGTATPVGEHWIAADAGLRGRGYVVRDGSQATSEHVAIIARDGQLFYVASPVGQTRTEFVVTEKTGEHFVAENPTHDFPTCIEYRRLQNPTRLFVRVSSPARAFELTLFSQ